MEKLHHELGNHSHFVKGEDKRLWSVEFGVRHYAGPVTYVVKNFLEKNKDVQQELFFDFLEKSSCEFAREVTKFRVSVVKLKRKLRLSLPLLSSLRTFFPLIWRWPRIKPPSLRDSSRAQRLARGGQLWGTHSGRSSLPSLMFWTLPHLGITYYTKLNY